MSEDFALNISQSLSGQPWHWRAYDARHAAAISQRFGVSDVAGRILAARDVVPEDAGAVLSPVLRDHLPDPSLFCDMDAAVARIMIALKSNEPIAIFGDYDVDGATSSALLARYFISLGVTPRIYIPDRFSEGYGPNIRNMELLANDGAKLIITVDCGTQSFEALAAAKNAGADVIVVDHHKASTELPATVALINPNRFDEKEGAAYGHLAAVGVAFLLAAGLNRGLRAAGYFNDIAEPNLLSLLDIVALGTVCDVVPLTGLNRAFVVQGLKVLARRENIGLTALMDISGLESAPDAGALGFHLGPRINAGGRVGRSDLGVRLLMTDSPNEAKRLAQELDALNAERKVIEAEVTEAALAQADNNADAVLVIAGENWHAGVIGIAASRVKDRFHRPTLVIGIDGALGKGSGRSIKGVDLGAAVLSAKEAGLLIAGGGHAMAAGLTIAANRINDLRIFLNEALSTSVSRARAEHGLRLDALIASGGMQPKLISDIAAAGPYGAGWATPRFVVGPVQILQCDVVGGAHVRLLAKGADGKSFKAIAFRSADTAMGVELLRPGQRQFYLAGRPVLNSWGGRDSAELHIEDAAVAL
jgi:single-stranded-DNA-specific exonuclease